MKLDDILLSQELLIKLLGPQNKNLKVIEDYFSVKVTYREDEIITNAINNKSKIEKIIQSMKDLTLKGVTLNERDISYLIALEDIDNLGEAFDFFLKRKTIMLSENGKVIIPKTKVQAEYVKAIENNDLVFGVGPAGTGKTYLAVLLAVKGLKEGKYKKIILTRPAVEAGEQLGFLPGDLKEKIDPYLKPLYDALYEFLGVSHTELLVKNGVIEISPLAYMRGRTYENSFIILDEAQNTTHSQMKMFLTRLGFSSKMVCTGDTSQIDLKKHEISGLVEAIKILRNIDGISVIGFSKLDCVRNPLVQKIIGAYDNENKDF
ncbi:MAG: PhoH family protein [Acholeplasmatales bacterium]|jgi:phosphate starvation-inducible PhoH-like protein|nr:PhoH family protein [Acholeplasmatales bacterium]